MSATVLGGIVAVVVMVLGIVYFLTARIDRRLERIEDRVGGLEQGQTDIKVAQAAYAQRLEDHIEAHPGPTRHLVQQ